MRNARMRIFLIKTFHTDNTNKQQKHMNTVWTAHFTMAVLPAPRCRGRVLSLRWELVRRVSTDGRLMTTLFTSCEIITQMLLYCAVIEIL